MMKMIDDGDGGDSDDSDVSNNDNTDDVRKTSTNTYINNKQINKNYNNNDDDDGHIGKIK